MIGINLQGDLTLARQQELAREAEAAGVTSLWTNDSLARDPFLVCQAWAAATQTLDVGIGVVQIPTRTPAQVAKAASTVQESSAGRLLLGLGVSQPSAMERWHGITIRRPVATARDALSIIRAATGGATTDHRGEALSSTGFRLDMSPLPPPPQLYLGAMRPRMLDLAGSAADGVLLSWESRTGIARAVEAVAAAAAAAGRPTPTVAGYVRVAISFDRAAARAALEREIDDYRQYYAEHFASQVPDGARLVEELGWYGTPDDGLLKAVDSYRAAGLDRFIAYLVPVGDPAESFRTLLRALR